MEPKGERLFQGGNAFECELVGDGLRRKADAMPRLERRAAYPANDVVLVENAAPDPEGLNRVEKLF